jgi:hypothetical protein
MHRLIDGDDRMQLTLLPNGLEDYVSEENPVQVQFVDEDLDHLAALGFAGIDAGGDGPVSLPPLDAAEDLPLLRLSQTHSVEPAPGTGRATQY